MSDTTSDTAAKRRPYSSAIAHLTPLALILLIIAQLVAVAVPRHSPTETMATMLFTVGSFGLALAWLRHGTQPCLRCLSVRERTGEAGAETATLCFVLYHQVKLLILSAVFLVVVGLGLTLWMGLSGHDQYAMWPLKIGGVLADAVIAVLAYATLCHIEFKPWCKLPHRNAAAAE
jgi:hypothetical protein